MNLLLTPREVADILRLKSTATLDVWRCIGRHPDLEWVKIGNKVRYKFDSVRDFIEKSTVKKKTK